MRKLFAWALPWVPALKYFAAGSFLAAFLVFHFVDKRNAIHNAKIEYTIELNKQAEVQRKAREKAEGELIAKHNILMEERDAQLLAVNASLDDALERLSNRPTRPASVSNPSTSKVEQACTGRELYREDGQFLAREAARAEALIIERDYFYNEYENARKKLEEYGNR